MFFFFNDPEGPNLLVVPGTALIVLLTSLAVYVSRPTIQKTNRQRLSLAILTQLILISGLYFLLR